MKRLFAVFFVVVMLSAVIVPLAAVPDPSSASESVGVFVPQVMEPSPLAEPAAAPLAVTSPMSDTVPYFLPLVVRNRRAPLSCSPDSPFSLQIADIHQVELDQTESAEDLAAAEAEWLAWYDEAFPSLLEALRESGACWSRVRVSWSLIEPDEPVEGQEPSYRWGTSHEKKLALIAGTGVQVIGVVESVPDWAAGYPFYNACSLIQDDRLDEFARFLTDLVNRYKEPPWNIHTWELRNEPDGTAEWLVDAGQGCAGEYGDKYALMLSLAYPAIKAADPGATVLMGGVAYDWFTEYDGPFNRYFPDDVMLSGGAAYMDAINLHYFPDFYGEWERWVPEGNPPTCGTVDDGVGISYEAWGIDLIAKTKHFRNRLATCFGVDKPVWVTELAEHGYPDSELSLAQQARYVIQGHARGLAAGVENITWFSLITPQYDAGAQGLLFEDLTPKPAYYAYQTLTGELDGYEYWRTLDVLDVEGYVFRNSAGQEKTAAWAWTDPEDPVFLTFVPASRLRVVDRDGTETYVDDGGPGDEDGQLNGSIKLQLPTVPSHLDPQYTLRYTAEPLIISQE